jgi:hypothetical protein
MSRPQQNSLPSWKGLCCLSRRGRQNSRATSKNVVVQSTLNKEDIPSTSHPPSKRRKKEPPSPPPPPQQRRRPRRIDRPGHNSYLKVLLDDHTIDTLHSYAIQIQKQLQQQQQQSVSEANTEEKVPSGTTERQQQQQQQQEQLNKKLIKFKPRSKQSLHVTLFFGGETLCEIPGTELVDW